MKKLIFGFMLILTAGLFASCQKGENFFTGTWQYVDTDGEDVYVCEVTLTKKDNAATFVEKYNNKETKREGSYTYYNENTIVVIFPKIGDLDEWRCMVTKMADKDDDRVYVQGVGEYFTKIKNK